MGMSMGEPGRVKEALDGAIVWEGQLEKGL